MPIGSRCPDFVSLAIVSNLLRLSETGVTEHYFTAYKILVKCAPKSFLYTNIQHLDAYLRCLTRVSRAKPDRRNYVRILGEHSSGLHVDTALILGAACIGVGEDALANALFATEAKNMPAGGESGSISGVFPVRTIFPNHLGRSDEAGLCRFVYPGVLGAPSGKETRLPLPHDGCAVVENAIVAGSFTVIDGDGCIAIYDLAGHPALPCVAGHYSLMKGSPMAS